MTRTEGEIERAFNVAQGKLIETKRKQRHLTQHMLSLEIGVHRNSVFRWESGGSACPTYMLLRIADVLECNHLSLLPPKQYTWGSNLALAVRERDPMAGLRYERDPKLSVT